MLLWVTSALAAPFGAVETLSVDDQIAAGQSCHEGDAVACRTVAAALEHAWAASWADAVAERGVPAPFRLAQAARWYDRACTHGDGPACDWLKTHRRVGLPRAPKPPDLDRAACATGDAEACAPLTVADRRELCLQAGGAPGDETPPACALPWTVVADAGEVDQLTTWGWFHDASFFDGTRWHAWMPRRAPSAFLHGAPASAPDVAPWGDGVVALQKVQAVGYVAKPATLFSGLVLTRSGAEPFTLDGTGIRFGGVREDGLIIAMRGRDKLGAWPGEDWGPRPRPTEPTVPDGWAFRGWAPDGSTYRVARGHQQRIHGPDHAVLTELPARRVVLGPEGLVARSVAPLPLAWRHETTVLLPHMTAEDVVVEYEAVPVLLAGCGRWCIALARPGARRVAGQPRFDGAWIRADVARERHFEAYESLRSKMGDVASIRHILKAESHPRDQLTALAWAGVPVEETGTVELDGRETLSGADLAKKHPVVVDARTVVVHQPLGVYVRGR